MTIGEKIRQVRGKDSRKEFAEKLGIYSQTLYMYEKGKRTPTLDIVNKICVIYGVKVEWLTSRLNTVCNEDEGFSSQEKGKAVSINDLMARITALEEENRTLARELKYSQEETIKAYKMAIETMRPGIDIAQGRLSRVSSTKKQESR